MSLPTWQEYMTAASEGLPSEPFPAAPSTDKTPPGDSVQKGVVPDVAGMVLSEAQGALTAAGYSHKVEKVPSDTVEKHRVIGTEPAPGTKLPEGQSVVIRQSTGP